MIVGSDNETYEDEATDEEDSIVSDDSSVNDQYEYTSPNGTVWTDQEPPARRLVRNIMNFQQGPRIIPRTEMEAFHLFIDEVILRTIQKYTNRRMKAIGKRPFSFVEIKACIAVVIRAGADRDNLSHIESLFNMKDSRPFYSCAISKNRFQSFMRYISFDNKLTRKERQKVDKLTAIREVWDLMQSNIRKYYEPSEWLTVDEQLYAYRGYVPGRAYMPAKPAKYGIKIFWCCDASNGFGLESYLYCGKKDNERAVGLPELIVLKLTQRFSQTNRNIFTDRYFTSFSLLENLLANGLTITGTIKEGRRDVPIVLRSTCDREIYDTKCLWNINSRSLLLSYLPNKNKNVLLMSSMHVRNVITNQEDQKPQVIIDYNAGKGGVDLMDSRIEDYTCKRKTNRYPLIFFFNMLDVCLLNAYLMMDQRTYRCERKEFIKLVADQMAFENILSRFNNQKVYCQLKDKFTQYGLLKPTFQPLIQTDTNPKKCFFKGCRKSTRTVCIFCQKPVCSLHKTLEVKCNNCINAHTS
jgi:hypothetical protein